MCAVLNRSLYSITITALHVHAIPDGIVCSIYDLNIVSPTTLCGVTYASYMLLQYMLTLYILAFAKLHVHVHVLGIIAERISARL